MESEKSNDDETSFVLINNMANSMQDKYKDTIFLKVLFLNEMKSANDKHIIKDFVTKKENLDLIQMTIDLFNWHCPSDKIN